MLLEGVSEQGHKRALLPFSSISFVSSFVWGLEYQTLFHVMIFTIHLMLFQYYCFFSKFIALFMI